MKTLSEIKRDIQIIKTFKGAGHYRIDVYINNENAGDYIETDMEHIADIDELENGFEFELVNSETFEEVYETTLRRLLRKGDCKEALIEDALNIYF
jgi:predicted RNA-binding protein associated with RNAse of E/G family